MFVPRSGYNLNLFSEILCKMHTVGLYGIDGKSYASLSPQYDSHGAVRITPPVPQYCSTPLGTRGNHQYLSYH